VKIHPVAACKAAIRHIHSMLDELVNPIEDDQHTSFAKQSESPTPTHFIGATHEPVKITRSPPAKPRRHIHLKPDELVNHSSKTINRFPSPSQRRSSRARCQSATTVKPLLTMAPILESPLTRAAVPHFVFSMKFPLRALAALSGYVLPTRRFYLDGIAGQSFLS
jgi:hypothetical protein